MFVLDQRLKDDTAGAARLKLCRVLLMNDSTVPWLILVPEREGVKEIYELSEEDRRTMIEETALASKVMEKLYGPDKINIGSLGNIVPQLHIHVVGRFKGDRAWPGPVWGSGKGVPYTGPALKEAVARIEREFCVINP